VKIRSLSETPPFYQNEADYKENLPILRKNFDKRSKSRKSLCHKGLRLRGGRVTPNKTLTNLDIAEKWQKSRKIPKKVKISENQGKSRKSEKIEKIAKNPRFSVSTP
tara:strand:+ start:167 stop:487 length:321 start_codon:yes stop_codon:yes gene_type:complete